MLGKSPYKSRHLQNIVVRESQSIAEYNHQSNTGIQLSLNFVSPVDIYDIKTKEVLYLDDGIGVKRQKEHRCKEGDSGRKSASTIQTDVILVQNLSNEYEYLLPWLVKPLRPMARCPHLTPCVSNSPIYFHIISY